MKKLTTFDLTEFHSKTQLNIIREDYDEEDNYNMHFKYTVTVNDVKFVVHSHLCYSVFISSMENENDIIDTECDFRDYWSIFVIPKPKPELLNLIRAAISFVYYLDPKASNCQEIADHFENRELNEI